MQAYADGSRTMAKEALTTQSVSAERMEESRVHQHVDRRGERKSENSARGMLFVGVNVLFGEVDRCIPSRIGPLISW